MRRSISRSSVIFALLLPSVGIQTGFADDAKKFEGKTIDEWVADFEGDFGARQKAIRTLSGVGTPAVPALLALIKGNDKTMGQSMQTLGKMGPDARPALPALISLIRNDNQGRKPPAGWTWNTTPRQLALSSVRSMEWAARELVPVLLAVAVSTDETESTRTRATSALGGLGIDAESALRKLARSESTEVKSRAHSTLAENAPQGKKEYYAELLEQEPCIANADSFLSQSKGIINSGKLDPLTERVKMGLRECLKEKPDAETAMTLAKIISNQLSSTALCWAAPSDSSRSLWDRENPKESFHSLREVFEIGFKIAKKGTAAHRKFGDALARLHLLLGDWKGMNRSLSAIGEKPVPKSVRKWMTAPPSDWKNLAANWKFADKSLRSSTATLVLEFEKDGKPLAGVHVLIKEAPKPQRAFMSGIDADTLFLSPMPLGTFSPGFGYMGADRAKTRYAISDARGLVRLERLPAIPVKLEVLVPTAIFPEPGSRWELWMEVQRGVFKLASNQPGPNTLSSQAAPGRVVLEEGKTTNYPKLIVRPHSGLNINDFASVDASRFVLTWQRPSKFSTRQNLRYEVELALSAPMQYPSSLPSTPTIRSEKQTVTETRWPLGEKGIGDIRLIAGNFYWLQVVALDENDKLAFRSSKTRFWVPWKHRASDGPVNSGYAGSRDSVPITHGKWWRGSASYGDGTKEDLRQQVDRFLETRKKAFEFEYVLLGSAWLTWRDGDPKAARTKLERLMKKLPGGNVARATAAALIRLIKKGGKCPKRLNFVDM